MSRIRAYLDTSAVIQVLTEPNAPELFSPEMLQKVTYVIGEVVFQELLLRADQLKQPVPLEQLEQVGEVHPFYVPLTGPAADTMQRLRHRAMHSNDVLAMMSAQEANCEFFITADQEVIAASTEEPYRAVTPEEFVSIVEGRT